MQPLLADPTLKPKPSDIAHARDAFREFLKIRGTYSQTGAVTVPALTTVRPSHKRLTAQLLPAL
jgi:hypothetical protein